MRAFRALGSSHTCRPLCTSRYATAQKESPITCELGSLATHMIRQLYTSPCSWYTDNVRTWLSGHAHDSPSIHVSLFVAQAIAMIYSVVSLAILGLLFAARHFYRKALKDHREKHGAARNPSRANRLVLFGYVV